MYQNWLHLGTGLVASAPLPQPSPTTAAAGKARQIAPTLHKQLRKSLSSGRISQFEFDAIIGKTTAAVEEDEKELEETKGTTLTRGTVLAAAAAAADSVVFEDDVLDKPNGAPYLLPMQQYNKGDACPSRTATAPSTLPTNTTAAETAAAAANGASSTGGAFAVGELIKALAAPNGAGSVCDGNSMLQIGYTSTEEQLQFYLDIAANLRCFEDPRWASACEAPEVRPFFCETLARTFQLYVHVFEQSSVVMPETAQHALMRQLLACADQALGYGNAPLSKQPLPECTALHALAAESILSVWSQAEALCHAPTRMWTELSTSDDSSMTHPFRFSLTRGH